VWEESAGNAEERGREINRSSRVLSYKGKLSGRIAQEKGNGGAGGQRGRPEGKEIISE